MCQTSPRSYGGGLAHEGNGSAHDNSLNLNITGSLDIDGGGLVSAIDKGYARDAGPGAATEKGGGGSVGAACSPPATSSKAGGSQSALFAFCAIARSC